MEKQYKHTFNPNELKKYLSSFGQRVLDVLMKQWKSDEFNKQNRYEPRYTPDRNRTTNTIREPIAPKIVNDIAIYDPINSTIPLEMNISDVPKSDELIKDIVVNQTNQSHDLSDTSDLINSVIEINEKSNYPIKHFKETINLNLEDTAARDSNTNMPLDISWNNMFDSELFSDIPLFKEIVNDKNICNDNSLSVEFRKENKIDFTTKETHNSNEIDKILSKTIKKVKKRKSSLNTADTALKKKLASDSVNTINNNFRKHKYTKMVKNWLNDIDPNHFVDEEIINKEEEKANEKEINKTKITFEKVLKPKVNKLIQSQLMNKGGVMKFGKPVERQKTIAEVTDNKITDIENKFTKCVTPMKSQIHVKDIMYDIIDGTTINNIMHTFQNTGYKDVVMVLYYSDGSCQLNKHNTDDNCTPKGIMFCVDDKFYYWQGSNSSGFRDDVIFIICNSRLICYDAKKILIYLALFFNLDIHTHTFSIADVKIGGGLLDPDNMPEDFSALQNVLSCVPEYTPATDCALQKCAWYILLLKESAAKLNTLLVEHSLWNVFVNIEMRLLPIIAEMEHRGVCVDLKELKSMENTLLTKMKAVEQECHKAAGKMFQINSTAQVRRILYDELQLDSKCNVNIRETICKGAKSTSETMLRSLMSKHPLPRLILEYRHLHKAHATFLSGVAQHVKDGLVKPRWVQTAAATGRIASNNPNLQAIPKAPFSLVMFPGGNDKDNQMLNFRSVYTARAGYTFLAADFKHVECRVFAFAASDTDLLDVLKTGDDLFKVLAGKWLNKPESDVSTEDRERTKHIVYASLYGAGTRRLMDILGVTYDKALVITASFNRTFPSLKCFGRSVVSRCEQSGGRLYTVCGRGRHFKNINSNDFALKSQAERQAVNFVVQGTAADLCKMAMVLTAERLRESDPPVDGHLLLQIHDELVWEVRDSDLDRAAVIIKTAMENCGEWCGVPVALPVAVSRGRRWGRMDPFDVR